MQWMACMINSVYRPRRAASGDHARAAGPCTRKLMSNDLRENGCAGVKYGYDRRISLTRTARLSGTSERLIICSIRARLYVAISTA